MTDIRARRFDTAASAADTTPEEVLANALENMVDEDLGGAPTGAVVILDYDGKGLHWWRCTNRGLVDTIGLLERVKADMILSGILHNEE